MKQDLNQGRADALGRCVAAAQAEADRFHGAGAARAWQPRRAPRRRPSMAAIAALSMATVAVAAGVWSMREAAPADTPQPAAATVPAPWFVAVAQGPQATATEVATDAVTDAVTEAVDARPAQRSATTDLAAPAPTGAPSPVDDEPTGLMNVPNLPDESAQVVDESQETSYDQGDGGVVPQE